LVLYIEFIIRLSTIANQHISCIVHKLIGANKFKSHFVAIA